MAHAVCATAGTHTVKPRLAMPLEYSCSNCDRLFVRTGRGTRCPTCAPYGWPTTTPMSPGWTRTRAQKLQANPYCENPYLIHPGQRIKAITVDHIQARAFGGTDEWANLRSLCQRCANRKDHQDREQGKRV